MNARDRQTRLLSLISRAGLAAAVLTSAAAAAQTTILRVEAPDLPAYEGLFADAVSSVGDVDGDGSDDLLIGSLGESGVDLLAGAVRVVSGDTGAVIHLIRGQGPFERFGGFVGNLGDADGDGAGDFVVGYAGFGASDWGLRAYSGKTAALLFELVRDDPDASFWGVAMVGDVDGDGVQDLGVPVAGTSPYDLIIEPGRARVYSGRTGELLLDIPGQDPRSTSGTGSLIAGVGDIDGDGHEDLGVSAPTPYSPTFVRILSGGSGELLLSLSSHRAGDVIRAACSAGDWNGDARTDFVVTRGTSTWSLDQSSIEIRSGVDGSVLQTLRPPPDQRFSRCINVGDVDGDGRDDLATTLGLSGDPVHWYSVAVLRGGEGSLICPPIDTTFSNPTDPSLASAGDLNGDGLQDLVYGEWTAHLSRTAVAFSAVPLEIGEGTCFGGAPGFPCPCGNEAWPAAESGCINSTGVGASLRGFGIHLHLNDHLDLELTGAAPSSPVIVLRDTDDQPPPPFASDGAPCLASREAVSTGLTSAAGTYETTVALGLYFTQGAYLQAWYRDTAPAAPCGTGNNFSSALFVRAF